MVRFSKSIWNVSEEFRDKSGYAPSTTTPPPSRPRRIATPAFIICVLALIQTGVQEQQGLARRRACRAL